jgi:L-lactate utilization protein LutC
MKKEIKFNHGEDSLTEALGINQSPEEIMDMITKTIILWSEDDRGSMTSILSEYIHKILPYEVILSIAT